MQNQCIAIAGVLVLIVTGCRSQPAPPTPEQLAIQALLAADDELGTIRNHASESMPLADAVRQYVASLDDLDFSNCPEPFTVAFRRHRDAWEEAIPFFERYPDLRGEMHGLFDKLKSDEDTKAQIEAIDKRIWDTWAEVEATTP